MHMKIMALTQDQEVNYALFYSELKTNLETGSTDAINQSYAVYLKMKKTYGLMILPLETLKAKVDSKKRDTEFYDIKKTLRMWVIEQLTQLEEK